MYWQNIDKKLLCYVVRTKITWIANAAVTAIEREVIWTAVESEELD